MLRQLPDHRWLWDLVAVVVRRRHDVAVACVVAAAGVVVLLLSPARSIPIICSFVQREYNSTIYVGYKTEKFTLPVLPLTVLVR